jgi:hypothetical protein
MSSLWKQSLEQTSTRHYEEVSEDEAMPGRGSKEGGFQYFSITKLIFFRYKERKAVSVLGLE